MNNGSLNKGAHVTGLLEKLLEKSIEHRAIAGIFKHLALLYLLFSSLFSSTYPHLT